MTSNGIKYFVNWHFAFYGFEYVVYVCVNVVF